jgi:hypothetical protein
LTRTSRSRATTRRATSLLRLAVAAARRARARATRRPAAAPVCCPASSLAPLPPGPTPAAAAPRAQDWFNAGTYLFSEGGLNYLGQEGLIHAQSLPLVFVSTLAIMGAVEGYRTQGGVTGEQGADKLYPGIYLGETLWDPLGVSEDPELLAGAPLPCLPAAPRPASLGHAQAWPARGGAQPPPLLCCSSPSRASVRGGAACSAGACGLTAATCPRPARPLQS